eukprot:2409346-Pyramimonas_sp.AAC.2
MVFWKLSMISLCSLEPLSSVESAAPTERNPSRGAPNQYSERVYLERRLSAEKRLSKKKPYLRACSKGSGRKS